MKKGIWGRGGGKDGRRREGRGSCGEGTGEGEGTVGIALCRRSTVCLWNSLLSWFLFQLHFVNLLVSCSSKSREYLVTSISTPGLWMTEQPCLCRTQTSGTSGSRLWPVSIQLGELVWSHLSTSREIQSLTQRWQKVSEIYLEGVCSKEAPGTLCVLQLGDALPVAEKMKSQSHSTAL